MKLRSREIKQFPQITHEKAGTQIYSLPYLQCHGLDDWAILQSWCVDRNMCNTEKNMLRIKTEEWRQRAWGKEYSSVGPGTSEGFRERSCLTQAWGWVGFGCGRWRERKLSARGMGSWPIWTLSPSGADDIVLVTTTAGTHSPARKRPPVLPTSV